MAMSRAFVRESDHSDDDTPPLPRPQLPTGVQNHITPAGAQRLQAELAALLEQKRQLSVANGSLVSSQIEPRSRKLESRIRLLQQIIESVVITQPPASSRDRVCFGATVMVRHANGEEANYQIVGIDETDLDRGHISWRSPLARALLSRRTGDRVRFRSPSGDEELQIVSVSYGE